jgi:hypothetical protein
MALPASVRDEAVAILERYCSARASDARRIEHRERGDAITLVERRPPWQPGTDAAWSSIDVAQLRYDAGSAHWSLFWPRASGRWERYDGVEPAASIATLLAEVDADPDGVFWG